MKLEYRLNDEIKHFPAIWHYDQLNYGELLARMTCEYFVKDGQTYRVTGTAIEQNELYVIYVEIEAFETDQNEDIYSNIGFEFQEIVRKGRYHLVERRNLVSHDEALPLLHCDFFYFKDGQMSREFQLDSREIDEDRRCYVVYGKFTNTYLHD